MLDKVYRNRLAKLAHHLLTLTPEYNHEHFRMRTFLEHPGSGGSVGVEQTIRRKYLTDCLCNTTACAVGHAPIVFPKLSAQIAKQLSSEGHYGSDMWLPFSKILFGITSPSDAFDFLFGGHWDEGQLHEYHSTSWAVADRIFYFLDHDDANIRINHWSRHSRYRENRELETASAYYSVMKGYTTQEQIDTYMAEIGALNKALWKRA